MNSSESKKNFVSTQNNKQSSSSPQSQTLNIYKNLKNGNNTAHYLIEQLNKNVNNTLNINGTNINKNNNNKQILNKNLINTGNNTLINRVNNNKLKHSNNNNNNNSSNKNGKLSVSCDVNKKSLSKENVNYLVSGSIAGAISRSATAGFERLTIIQQVQGMSQNIGQQYVGCVAALKEMIKREGFKSIWKGNGANIVKVSPNSGIRFLTYEFCKTKFLSPEIGVDKMTVPQTMFAGAMAGLTSTFFTYPLDVVRIRLSLQGCGSHDYAAHRYNGIIHSFAKIYMDEGIKGLYKGLGTSIASIVPWVSISFATYEGFKIIAKNTILDYRINQLNNSNSNNDNDNSLKQLAKTVTTTATTKIPIMNTLSPEDNELKKGVNMICDFVCGALSGAVTMTVCYPLDVLRRRMMIQGIGGNQVLYKNGWDAAKKIIKTEGMAAFYHGIIPAYFKVVPTVAISFAVYEICKDLGGSNNNIKN